MKIALLGVTGPTGRSLLERTLANGHDVVALARRPEAVAARASNLRVVAGDVMVPATLPAALAGCDAVVSCVGVSGLLQARKGTTLYSVGTRNLTAAMRAAGVARLVVVSSGGVEPQPNDGWFFRRVLKPFFLEPMYVDMRVMERELQASDLQWTIVRAPYLTNGAFEPAYRVSPDRPFADDRNLSRRSLSHFLLSVVESAQFVRRIVYVSS